MKNLLFMLIGLLIFIGCSNDDKEKFYDLEFDVKYQSSPESALKPMGCKIFIFPGDKEYKKVIEPYTEDMFFSKNEYIVNVSKTGIAETIDGDKINCIKQLETGDDGKLKFVALSQGIYYVMIIPDHTQMEYTWWACDNKYTDTIIEVGNKDIYITKVFWGDESYRGYQGWDVPETWSHK